MRISDADNSPRDPRLERLTERLPRSMRPTARWLQGPSARLTRIPAGVLLCAGGVLGFMPILGFWMVPAGLVLLAEDVPPLRRARGRMLDWVERRHPDWFAPAGDDGESPR